MTSLCGHGYWQIFGSHLRIIHFDDRLLQGCALRMRFYLRALGKAQEIDVAGLVFPDYPPRQNCMRGPRGR